MALTQKQLILKYLAEFGTITPAKMAGKVFYGTMFGSETSRACRALRAEKKIFGRKEGKFEVFYLPSDHPPLIREKNKCCSGFPFFQIHNQDCITLKKQNLFS